MSVIRLRHAATLESVMLGGAKHIILGCSSKTCNETVREGVGLETVGIKAKLKLW